MTDILSIDRGDGLVGSKNPAKYSLLMQGSSYEKERVGSKKENQEHTIQQQQHHHRPHQSTQPKEHRGMNKSEEMTTMHERYRFQQDEEGNGKGESKTNMISSPSSSHGGGGNNSNNGGGNGGNGLKRRHSQRSPSRPRSQQGSQAAQIATIKEVEREMEQGNEEEGALSDDESRFRHGITASTATAATDSPRKVARLDEQPQQRRYGRMSPDSTPTMGWQNRLHPSESESTSATSSRVPMSNSHNSSMDEDPSTKGMRRRMEGEGNNMEEQEQGANYTWQHQENTGSGSLSSRNPTGVVHHPSSNVNRTGGGAGGKDRLSNLPNLVTGFQAPNAPSSAPLSATNAESGEPLSSRMYERSSSPTPRLPGFAALSPYQPQTRGRLTSPTPSNNQTTGNPPSGLSNIAHHHQHHHQGQQPQQQQRRDEYGYSSHVITSPRMPGPSSMSANSPSLSHSSHQTPGQAFIHPSLAGLPGTGGEAGSKQQPSFVSKLYSMLEDETIADMIAWGPSGMTFSVANPGEFAKIVLPNWFKHSNWQSFVRQLNMYGFHKVNHTYQGTPEAEIQVWEFKHPNFRRGEVHLLSEIKRKSSRHKRQDSMTRSMTNAAEYEMMGTPSPEMGMMTHGGHMVGGSGMMQQSGSHSMTPYGSQGGQVVRSHHPGQGSIHHHPYAASRQQGGGGGPVGGHHYSDYSDPSGIPASGGGDPYPHHRDDRPSASTAMQQPSRVHHHSESNVSGGGQLVERASGGQSTMMGATSEGVVVRMDDLSDRIDAIIRHASYLEGQLRTVSDQVYHMQQNDASLRSHVHYLESQMRSLSDQLFQQRQPGGSATGGGPSMPPTRPFTPPQPQGGQQSGGNAPGIPPGSPSSSSFSGRMRQLQHPGSPPPSIRESAGRFQGAGPQSQQQQQSSMPSYVSRSPSMANPSFPNRGQGSSGGGIIPLNAPPPPPSLSSSVGGQRAIPASSADAYTKLRPPPPPPGGNVQRTKRDSPV